MNLNGKVTNPGELRTQVSLYKRSVTTLDGGFMTPDLVHLGNAWAKWENVHGQESWVASSVQARQAATVTIRWRDDLDETCVIKKGSDYFEIVTMDNMRERNEYIELKVQRWQPG